MTCLEALYQVCIYVILKLKLFIYCVQKLSGHELMYTALVGKPYEISFQYSEMMGNKLARAKHQSKLGRIYFVG